jgi:NADPH:quinone reductase-like Zn-dependent oxidoreductase
LEREVKTVRLYEYGGPESLKYEDNVPEPMLSDDSVLVETSATSVNPIDWKVRSGARQKDFPLKLPAIPHGGILGGIQNSRLEKQH